MGQLSLKRDMEKAEFIAEIEKYCKEAGISPATLCGRVLDNNRVYRRLKGGYGCSVDSYFALKNYMKNNPAGAAA
jgi:hypothetical protein